MFVTHGFVAKFPNNSAIKKYIFLLYVKNFRATQTSYQVKIYGLDYQFAIQTLTLHKFFFSYEGFFSCGEKLWVHY